HRFFDKVGSLDDIEQGRIFMELAIISVLLDAGAGSKWSYSDKASGQDYYRSEGLAVASFNLYTSGFFSTDKDNPYRVDKSALEQLTQADMEAAFQVNADNPMTGLAGRFELLSKLASVLDDGVFKARLGH